MAYSGVTAPIPIGLRGLDGRKNPDVIPAGALTKTDAIQFDGTVIGAEGGAEKIDSAGVSGTPICRGLHDWWPTAGTQRLVSYWSDGKVYKETNDDLDATTLKSGLSQAVLGQFVEGGEEDLGNNRKLFLLNGVDSPQVLSADGTTMAAISSPAADWTGANQPIAAVVHGAGVGSAGGGYMWYALGHRAYRSKADDHEDLLTTVYTMVFFPGLGTKIMQMLVFFPGLGTKIMQMLTFNGLMYVFKDKGICWLDDSNPDDTKWAPRIKSVVHGIPSPQAALGRGQ
jgi:hypothetical protein